MPNMRYKWIFAGGFLGLLSLAAAAQQGSGNAGNNGFIVGSNPQGASVQGQSVLPGTAVMPGEQVQTDSGGSITLVGTSPQGGVVQIGHQSNSTIVNSANGPQVNLNSGYAQVQGQVSVATCNSVVQPTNSQTNVTVVANGCNQTLVQQNSGTATVQNVSTGNTGTGNQSQTLNAGNAVSVTSNSINTVPVTVINNAATPLAPTAPPANGNNGGGNNNNNNNNNSTPQNSPTGEPG